MKKQNQILIVLGLVAIAVGFGLFMYFGLKAGQPAPTSEAPTTNCGVLPLDVVLVIDRSGSMSEQDSNDYPPRSRMSYAQEAASNLVDKLNENGGVGGRGYPQHHLGVVSFGGDDESGVTVDVPLGNSDATEVKAGINALRPNGGTPLKTAMAKVKEQLTTNQRETFNGKPVQHIVVLLSDGKPDPEAFRPSDQEITDYLASANKLYAIALGKLEGGAVGVDLTLMKLLAKPSTAYHQVTRASELPALFNDIFTEIACKSADLSLKKEASSASPAKGDKVTFSITVQNDGPDEVAIVAIKDELPAGLEMVSNDGTEYQNGIWNVRDLASGAKKTLQIETTVTAEAGSQITNVAEINEADLGDPDSTPNNQLATEDDYASVTVTVATASVTPTPTTDTTPPTTDNTPTITPTTTTTTTATPSAPPDTGSGGDGWLALIGVGLMGLGYRLTRLRASSEP